MKIFFSQNFHPAPDAEEDYTLPDLREDMQKTRTALEIAYAGFDNATDEDLIDCYIFEINSLLKRYKYLSELAAKEPQAKEAAPSLSFRALTARVLEGF